MLASAKTRERKLVDGEQVSLVRVPENRVHCNAIAVHDRTGKRAGWVPREMADVFSPALLNGEVKVLRIQGQEESTSFLEIQS